MLQRKNGKMALSIFFFVLAFVWISMGHAAVKGAPKSPSGQVIQSKGQVNAPKGTPTYEIQKIEKKMDEYKTGKRLSPAEKASNRRVKREILSGAFDLRELSRRSLDKHWGRISAGERSNFVNLMTSLLETKAIFSKEQSKTKGKSYIINYKGDKYQNGKSQAEALTQIYVLKENITLDIDYKLKKAGGGWKVFDVVVDDASLVENYRYQFNKIITKHGYSELVRRMRKKLTELKAKEA